MTSCVRTSKSVKVTLPIRPPALTLICEAAIDRLQVSRSTVMEPSAPSAHGRCDVRFCNWMKSGA
jgi:hypothetical protein